MPTPTLSRESLKVDRSTFDLSRLEKRLGIDRSKLEERIDFSNIDLSGFDLKRLADFDFTRVDFSKIDVDRFADFDIDEQITALNKAMDEQFDQVNERLDHFQAQLPPPVDRVFHLQRVVAETGYELTRTATDSLVDAVRAMIEQLRQSSQRVATTFRDEADEVRSDVTRMAVATQAAASDVVDELRADVAHAADAVADRVEALGDEAVDYSAWSKDELYDRAQALDIAGRSSMSKDELIAAVAEHR